MSFLMKVLYVLAAVLTTTTLVLVGYMFGFTTPRSADWHAVSFAWALTGTGGLVVFLVLAYLERRSLRVHSCTVG